MSPVSRDLLGFGVLNMAWESTFKGITKRLQSLRSFTCLVLQRQIVGLLEALQSSTFKIKVQLNKE